VRLWGGFVGRLRENGVEPFAYLRDVLTKLPTHPTTRLGELTAGGWQAARAVESTTAADAATSS